MPVKTVSELNMVFQFEHVEDAAPHAELWQMDHRQI